MIGADDVPWKVRLSNQLWEIRGDAALFKQQVKDMLERCYPGFIPIKTQYPFVLCRCDRELRRQRLAEEAARWQSK